MSGSVQTTVAVIAALGCALMGGVFLAFSTIVMSGLRRVPTSGGLPAMQAMQAINAAVGPIFLAAFMGPAVLCLALGVDAGLDLDDDGAALRLAGALLYLAGSFGLTVGYHVPRNDRLAGVDPADPAAEEHWRRYAADWTRWNHVRALASIAAAVLLILAVLRGR